MKLALLSAGSGVLVCFIFIGIGHLMGAA